MRRLFLTTVASAAVFALVPAGALARHHARHHNRVHHSRARIRHERFGVVTAPPATTPAPTTPGTPPADSVGTVASSTNGTLTITLNSGSTVSGMVTADTEIECESSMAESMQSDDRGGGDNSRPGGGDSSGPGGNGNGDNDQDDEAANQACSSAGLTPGAFIRGAELQLSSAGAVWEKVDLIL